MNIYGLHRFLLSVFFHQLFLTGINLPLKLEKVGPKQFSRIDFWKKLDQKSNHFLGYFTTLRSVIWHCFAWALVRLMPIETNTSLLMLIPSVWTVATQKTQNTICLNAKIILCQELQCSKTLRILILMYLPCLEELCLPCFSLVRQIWPMTKTLKYLRRLQVSSKRPKD